MLIKKSRVPLLAMMTVGLLPSSLKVLYYRLRGYRIGKDVRIGPLSVVIGRSVTIGDHVNIGFATILRGKEIALGRHVTIGSMVFFDVRRFEIQEDAKINEQVYAGGPMLPESYLRIGKRAIVMQLSFLNPTKPLIIGDDTGIGGHCLLFTHGSWQPQSEGYPVTFAPITLGSNVWLPWRVFILPGVSVGDGTTIGANSLVTKDLPAHCLAAGSPAKVIRGPEGYPPRLEQPELEHLFRTILEELARYLLDEGLTIRYAGGVDGLDWTAYRGSRRLGRLVCSSGWVDPAPIDGRDVVIFLAGDREGRSAGKIGNPKCGMVVDLVDRRRWGSTQLGEEAIHFFARYGLRFRRED